MPQQVPVDTAEAIIDGEWLVCPRPGCRRKLGLRITATAPGARIPCKSCRRWVGVPFVRQKLRSREG